LKFFEICGYKKKQDNKYFPLLLLLDPGSGMDNKHPVSATLVLARAFNEAQFENNGQDFLYKFSTMIYQEID
jgi:hypothetical protein